MTRITEAGKTYSVPEERGARQWPLFLTGYRLTTRGWHQVDRVASIGGHYGEEVPEDLPAYSSLGPRTSLERGDEESAAHLTAAIEPHLAQQLLPLTPIDDGVGAAWKRVLDARLPLCFYTFVVDSEHITPYALVLRNGRWQLLEGGLRPRESSRPGILTSPQSVKGQGEPQDPLLDGTSDVNLHFRGPFMLMKGMRSEAGAKLYDLRGVRLVFSSAKAERVTFWPHSTVVTEKEGLVAR